MQEKDELLNQLEQILHFKKSKRFYAERLGVTEEEINELYKEFRSKNQIEEKESIKSAVKILLLDIETSLMLATIFQKQVWKARIKHEQIISDYYMLTWSAKWLGDDIIMSNRLTPEEVYNEDDSRIVKNLLHLLDECDIVVGHNSDAFDIPNIFTRCVQHGFSPPSPFRQIDTLKIAQKYFGFTHNSLDALAKFFRIDGKIPTTLDLWKECIRGNEESLVEMETYNRQDVAVLEEIYIRLRPFAKGLPNADMYNDSELPTCPCCGRSNIFPEINKFFFTNSSKFQLFRCSDCTTTFRSRKGIKLYNKLVSPIPR